MTGYKTILIFLFCVFATAAQCQETAAANNSFTQNAIAAVKEKIYVHTDKTVYIAGEILWVKLYTVNTENYHLFDLSKIGYIELIDSINKPVAQIKISLHNGLGNSSFIISPTVPSGNYKLRAYTSWMKNSSPDEFFQKDITIINTQKLTVNRKDEEANSTAGEDNRSISNGQNQPRFINNTQASKDTLSLTLSVEKLLFNAREKVTLSMTASNIKDQLDSAFLSVSVYRVDSLQPVDGDRITRYLLSASESNTATSSPNHSAFALEQNDNTQSRKSQSSFAFAPEYSGHIITGKVLAGNGQPKSDVTAYLSIPGKGTQFYPGVSDADGIIQWETKDFYGGSQVIVQTEKDSGYTIHIDSPFSHSFSSAKSPGFSLPDHCPNTLSEHSISMQVQHIYSEARIEQFKSTEHDTIPFYATAGKTYWLDDFTRFNTLEEVLREYVAMANVSRRKGDYHLPVYDSATQLVFERDPLLLLDGVPFFDFNRFMSFDPQKIQKLEVVYHRFFYGKAIFDGILNWHSYNGELAETSLDPKAMVAEYDGLALQREFYSPVYETEAQRNSHLPDFRNMLYWNPDIILKDKQELSFYTSDLPGKYVAVVQGITQSGLAGSQMISFEVSK